MGCGDWEAEAVAERFCNVRLGLPMGDVLVHGPTFQGVEVLLEKQVIDGQEPLLARSTPMPGGGEASYPSPDAAPGYPKVECHPGPAPVLTPGKIFAPAGRARLTADLHGAVDPKILPPLPFPLVNLIVLQGLVGADVHLVSLVVEVSPLVNKVEAWDGQDLSPFG